MVHEQACSCNAHAGSRTVIEVSKAMGEEERMYPARDLFHSTLRKTREFNDFAKVGMGFLLPCIVEYSLGNGQL